MVLSCSRRLVDMDVTVAVDAAAVGVTVYVAVYVGSNDDDGYVAVAAAVVNQLSLAHGVETHDVVSVYNRYSPYHGRSSERLEEYRPYLVSCRP
ncbi:hypothetical protein WICPIJ_004314 [Wickerhamomyces pijperi]|uniref:Uncharacterized protein n=1 Tax=Wickerhamomyces pijperi TaxID=599730 RepID=A0A9P8Q5W2_WICPI|nr:hypothetical protein WICPIJ_004314 [Wickerhamomyces pijperi]